MSYLHGFDEVEQQRLVDQAKVLQPKIFENVDLSGASKILEIGSGVGAQTEILLNKYPKAHVTGVEYSQVQLDTSVAYITSKFEKERFSFYQMDAQNMSFEENTFDAIYICWVLEHIPNPQKVIDECYRVLKKGGRISITEVQNNTLYFVPNSTILTDYWNKYNQLQQELGGNPFVGVEIGNFLSNASFENINILPNYFQLDNNTPEDRRKMVDYWHDLMLSGFDGLLKKGRVKKKDREFISKEMDHVKKENGVFHYSFIQANAVKTQY